MTEAAVGRISPRSPKITPNASSLEVAAWVTRLRLGCTIEELKVHLENQFKEELRMSDLAWTKAKDDLYAVLVEKSEGEASDALPPSGNNMWSNDLTIVIPIIA